MSRPSLDALESVLPSRSETTEERLARYAMDVDRARLNTELCRSTPIPGWALASAIAGYVLVALAVFAMTKYINPCYWDVRQPLGRVPERAFAAVFWPVYLAAAAVSQTFRGADAAADFIFKPAPPAEAPPR